VPVKNKVEDPAGITNHLDPVVKRLRIEDPLSVTSFEFRSKTSLSPVTKVVFTVSVEVDPSEFRIPTCGLISGPETVIVGLV
jgi:hypothetical protein